MFYIINNLYEMTDLGSKEFDRETYKKSLTNNVN